MKLRKITLKNKAPLRNVSGKKFQTFWLISERENIFHFPFSTHTANRLSFIASETKGGKTCFFISVVMSRARWMDEGMTKQTSARRRNIKTVFVYADGVDGRSRSASLLGSCEKGRWLQHVIMSFSKYSRPRSLSLSIPDVLTKHASADMLQRDWLRHYLVTDYRLVCCLLSIHCLTPFMHFSTDSLMSQCFRLTLSYFRKEKHEMNF